MSIVFGTGCPKAFLDYLQDKKTEKIIRCPNLKVTFGPNESFFAWDSTSIRWSKIPEGLETCIQGWLSPTGWTQICGPPSMVSLGADGAWFAESRMGQSAWSFPASWKSLRKNWNAPNMHSNRLSYGLLVSRLGYCFRETRSSTY